MVGFVEGHAVRASSLACAAAALLLGCTATPGWAHSKTDVVTLDNGNEILGEIKGLLQGRLSFGTNAMGTVKIEWEDIVAVNSEFRYEVRQEDGERHYGSLASGESPRQLRVRDGDTEWVVAMMDVIEIRPVEKKVSDRLDIRLGLGYSYENASRISSFSLTSEFSYQDERGVTGLNGRTQRTDQDDANVGSNRYSLSRQFWTRRRQVARWFDGSYENNDELQLDYRFTAGLGLGKALVDTNRQSFVGFLGLQGATESSVESESLESLEGVLGATYSLWRFDTPELDLDTGLTVYPGITEGGRWRGNANIRLSWELVEDLFWDITTWGTYDNRSESGSDSDYGVTTGIGWTY